MNQFLAICYHYIRTQDSIKEIPRIIGHTEELFYQHLDALQERYRFISLPDLNSFFSKTNQSNGDIKTGMLLTFDDGLSDHYIAAKILYKRGIKATFFIPTCVTEDKLPPNPTIIHYGIAIYGISRFLCLVKNALRKFSITLPHADLEFNAGIDSPWEKIIEIKKIFRYKIGYINGRRVLLEIFESALKKDTPNIINKMHLTDFQIKDILSMGHDIGVHSHSHISVAATNLNKTQLDNEIIKPKNILIERFGQPITAFSYPFGNKKDCLSARNLLKHTKQYKFAFTVDHKVNHKKSSPYELGRYMPKIEEEPDELIRSLKIIQEKERSFA